MQAEIQYGCPISVPTLLAVVSLCDGMICWFRTFGMRQEIFKNMVCVTSKGLDQPAHMRSLQSLYKLLDYSMNVKLLTKHNLEFLSC